MEQLHCVKLWEKLHCVKTIVQQFHIKYYNMGKLAWMGTRANPTGFVHVLCLEMP